MTITRRIFAGALLALAAAVPLGFGAPAAQAADPVEFRIGWQKGGSLAVVKARGAFEQALKDKQVTLKWLEFPAGPQMLEALNVGSIDLALTGETPPVFAQAAGANLLYVGNEPPAHHAEVLLVPKDSPVKSVAELKGKRVALNKGSNVHYLLVRLLEKAGLTYGDVQVAFLPPADARAAFEKGAVDAWAVWDPYAAAAEAQIGARRLADAEGVVDNHIFYLAARPFAEKHPEVLAFAIDQINLNSKWLEQNIKEAAAVIAPQIGVTQEVAEGTLSHYRYGVTPLTDDIIRRQQKIADTFFELKLIPKQIDIASAVWRPKS